MWDKIAEIAVPVILGGALTYGGKLARAWMILQEKKLELQITEIERLKVDKAIDDAVRAVEEESRTSDIGSADKENLAIAKFKSAVPEASAIDEPILRQKIKAKVNAKFNDKCS